MKWLSVCLTFLVFISFQTGFCGWEAVSAPVRLAGEDGEVYMRPIWSPAGDWIAFTQTGYRGIFIMRPETGQIQQLSDEPGAGFGFAWSGNGNYIVSRMNRYDGGKYYHQVKTFEIASGKSQVISDENIRFRGLPRWSQDNNRVYILERRNIRIFEIAQSTTSGTDEDTGFFTYLKYGKIVSEQPATKRRHEINPIEGKQCLNLAVSPDGQKVAFEIFGGNLYTMNIDGSELIDLGKGYRPQWAPDGGDVAFMLTEDDGHVFTNADIYIAKADGSRRDNITAGTGMMSLNPSWAPDQSQLVFDNYRDGAIYTIAIEYIEE